MRVCTYVCIVYSDERLPACLPMSHLIPITETTRQVKPGDRVQVMGVYKALAGQNNGATSGACLLT